VALSAGCVANANGADAAYYNPANMVYNDDANSFEGTAIYAHLTPIRFQGSFQTLGPFDSKSEAEDAFIPALHYTSPKMVNGMRWGLSIVSPGGLTKRWQSAPGIFTSEEFTLQTLELNPTLAIPVTDRFSVAVGVRALYAEGVVKSTAPTGVRDMDGDGLDFGYNLALSFKATDAMTMSATYRSKIDMKLEGDATINLPTVPLTYAGSAEVGVVLPASLNLAVAHTVGTTTVEFDYERTFWSSYETLDFNYPDATGLAAAVLEASPFGAPSIKNWKDSNTYRLAMTHVYNENWTVMGAVAYDETPVPDASLGFELPDSDAWVVSFGGRYNIDKQLSIGASALASIKDERTVDQGGTGIQGKFSEAAAYLIAVGMEYKF
jgi:long-chain fatty acid transport protein